MKHAYTSLLVVVIFSLASCIPGRYPGGRDYPNDKDNKRDNDEHKRAKDEDGRTYPFSGLGIPKCHLPPPGDCKIWIPGKSPGKQGPPQSCILALRNAPLGAWVITHEGSRYKVNIFNRTRRSVIDEVRYYKTGDSFNQHLFYFTRQLITSENIT